MCIHDETVQLFFDELLLLPREVAKYRNECVQFSVCLSACLSQKQHGSTSPNFVGMLPVAVARSSSDSVAIKLCTSSFVDGAVFSRRSRFCDALCVALSG